MLSVRVELGFVTLNRVRLVCIMLVMEKIKADLIEQQAKTQEAD
jgi:hypothetical protein